MWSVAADRYAFVFEDSQHCLSCSRHRIKCCHHRRKVLATQGLTEAEYVKNRYEFCEDAYRQLPVKIDTPRSVNAVPMPMSYRIPSDPANVDYYDYVLDIQLEIALFGDENKFK